MVVHESLCNLINIKLVEYIFNLFNIFLSNVINGTMFNLIEGALLHAFNINLAHIPYKIQSNSIQSNQIQYESFELSGLHF